MTYEYDLQILNNKIAECLAGNGEYSTLQVLRREKNELLDKQHFERIKTVRDEISQLEQWQTELRDEIAELENQKKEIAIDEDLAALRLEKIRLSHAEKNGEIYLRRIDRENNRKAILKLKENLNDLIKEKLSEETI